MGPPPLLVCVLVLADDGDVGGEAAPTTVSLLGPLLLSGSPAGPAAGLLLEAPIWSRMHRFSRGLALVLVVLLLLVLVLLLVQLLQLLLALLASGPLRSAICVPLHWLEAFRCKS